MKRLGKKKIISLIMVLSMVITTIFSLQISNVDASTNTEKAKELVSKMTLEENYFINHGFINGYYNYF